MARPNTLEKTLPLDWRRRAVVTVTTTHKRRSFETRCGLYRVVHSHCLLGRKDGKDSIPDVYQAMHRVVDGEEKRWELIGRHRTPNAARKACQKHAKENPEKLCEWCLKRLAAYQHATTLFEADTQLCPRCASKLLGIATANGKRPRDPFIKKKPQGLQPSPGQIPLPFDPFMLDGG